MADEQGVVSHSFRRLLIVVGLLSVVIAGRATSCRGGGGRRRSRVRPTTRWPKRAPWSQSSGASTPTLTAAFDLDPTDPSPAAEERARVALTEVFGADWPNGPGGEVLSDTNTTIHRADYGFAQLKQWHDAMTPVLTVTDVVFTDVDERANRLLVGVADPAAEGAVRDEAHPARDPTGRIPDRGRRPGDPGLVGDVARHSHSKGRRAPDHEQRGHHLHLGIQRPAGGRRRVRDGLTLHGHCGRSREHLVLAAEFAGVVSEVCLPLAYETVDPPFLDSSSNWLCPSGRVAPF